MNPKSKRILIGCGIGCGSMVLLAVVLAVAFGTWIAGKGELLEPQRLLGADNTGYLEWTLRLEDPGTEGFLQLVIEALEDERAGQTQRMPAWLRSVVLARNKDTAKEIRGLFPVVVAWTMAPGDAADRDEMLFTVSPTGMGNRLVFADWMVSFAARWSDDDFVREYRDEKIYRIDSGKGNVQTIFLRGGTIFFTTDLDSAMVAVDRLQKDDPARREPSPLDPLFAETSREETLRGALTNRRGEATRLWNEMAGGDGNDLLQAVRGVTLGGGLREDGSLEATLRFRGPDRDWAEEHVEPIRESIADAFSRSDLDPAVRASTSREIIRIELRAEDIVGKLRRWTEEQERR